MPGQREALKVGISGVRGVVGQALSPQVAASFAQAFGTMVGHGSVVVGRDTRPSGLMIQHAIEAGLKSIGCKPILAGVVATPTVLFLTRELGARGGIAITASHNPAQWNAFKFVDDRGLFLNEARAEELFDLYHQGEFSFVEEDRIPRASVEWHPVEGHLGRVRAYVDEAAIRARRFKVAVDCCNGVGALYSRAFLEEAFGCEVVTVLDDPSGAFEREPEPLPENLGRLCEAVVREKCDIGFAQDPDGDRLALVNEKGEPLGEDLTLALAVQQVLARHAKGPVAVNLASSKAVDSVAAAEGCEVVRTKVGEINVSETMLDIGAVVGGENNGGVILPEIHPCRDSFGGMAVLLELMAHRGKTLSELRAAIPVFSVVKEKMPARSEQAPRMLRAVRRHYADQKLNLLDGVHVDFGDRWVHVRRSNTEPVLRFTAEAATREEAEALVQEVRMLVAEVDH